MTCCEKTKDRLLQIILLSKMCSDCVNGCSGCHVTPDLIVSALRDVGGGKAAVATMASVVAEAVATSPHAALRASDAFGAVLPPGLGHRLAAEVAQVVEITARPDAVWAAVGGAGFLRFIGR